jgi:Protein of unknown function (DUF1501)
MPQPAPRLVSRRQVLQAGAIGYLGLSLPRLLRADALGTAATADSCILIFLNGGPSHLDMWDLKPEAPVEVRGEFRPISSSLPGVPLSEHLPRLARLMDRATLIRSAHHSVNNAHAAAVYTALTGHDRGDATVAIGASPNDQPAIGAVIGQQRPPRSPVVPYVSLPYMTKEGAGGPPQPGFFGGLLGRTRDPLWVLKDPNAPGFEVPELTPAPDVPASRLADRRNVLRGVGGKRLGDLDAIQQKAFDLLTAPATQRAFRLDLEPVKTRDVYGRNIYGQSVLLARRLIEAGTRVACISWAPDANATWDTHGNNFVSLKTRLLPQLDGAVSSLIDDLVARGLFERTLVVVMGEFGRSPKVNASAGRDHWNYCYTLMLAGGGVRGGHVFGASDKIGGRPSSNPVMPADIVATIYHCLGVPRDLELRDNLDRPFQLVPGGDVIREVLV